MKCAISARNVGNVCLIERNTGAELVTRKDGRQEDSAAYTAHPNFGLGN